MNKGENRPAEESLPATPARAGRVDTRVGLLDPGSSRC
jgi:hypothetical protein